MRLSGIAIALVVATSGTARAEHARLAYAGTACAVADLEQRIAVLDARDTFASDGTLRLDVVVEPRADALHASIVAYDARGIARGHRDLSAPGCEALFDAVALVAILVAHEALDVPAAEPAVVPTEPGSEAEPAQRSGLLVAVGGAASGSGDYAVLAGVRLRSTDRSIGLVARFGIPEQLAMATVARTELSLVPCEQFGRLALCAGVAAGLVRGRSTRTVYEPLLATGARIAWEQPVTRRIGIGAELDAEVTLTHQQFRVDDVVVWSSRRFDLWGGVAVLVSIP